MNIQQIVHAWRDGEFRDSLNPETLANLPDSPVGEIELNDSDLGQVVGESVSVNLTIAVTVGVSAVLCASYFNGGSCEVDTSGCCTHKSPEGQ